MNNAEAITVTWLIIDIVHVIESFEYQRARLILDNRAFLIKAGPTKLYIRASRLTFTLPEKTIN